MRVDVVSVPVGDQDRAKKFYLDVLGFAERADTRIGPDMRWVMLDPPGGGAAITLVTWFPTMPAGSLKGLVYAVDDVDRAHAELLARGAEIPEGMQQQPWGRFFTLDDPDGNGIVVQQAITG
jgi:predicted enzyme related to lactoylglutathione lyase